jgi:hypothetical protein
MTEALEVAQKGEKAYKLYHNFANMEEFLKEVQGVLAWQTGAENNDNAYTGYT